jgi:hypothetical protein
MLIDQRGITMPLEDAVKQIAFHPYLPPGQIMAFAVIPPLGGVDSRKNRGIATEYVSGRVALLLSEWPKQRFDLAFPKKNITASPCEPVNYARTGIIWTSRNGFALTLQPDGNVNQSALGAEAHRLISAGACK